MPPLQTLSGLTTTYEGKEEALRARFFPESTADLLDITSKSFTDNTFTNPLYSPQEATKEEV